MEKMKLSRRNFLKSMGLGALGLMMSEAKPASAFLFGWGPNVRLGRILRFNLHAKKEPDHLADSNTLLVYDDVLPIRKMVFTRNIYGKRLSWYELETGEYVDATWVQPVYNRRNPIDNRPIPEGGCLGEVTVPLVPVYSKPNVRDIHRTFYYENNFWIKDKVRDGVGFPWYELWDDLSGVSYFVRAYTMRRISEEEITPLSPDVPADQKRLVLELGYQIVRAYEYNKLVWEAPVSSGKIDGSTPVGRWMTNRKRPCRRMINEPHNPNVYDLPGVPWVSYITIEGVAFHGTYWHSNWGKVMSNGCINMKNADAQWLYRWTHPDVPFNQFFYTEPIGTRVDVITGFGDQPKN
jgi:lipoprotein-anchoring transpeptidase ErfK/SrfK